MRGMYKGILVEVYEFSSTEYHIEPVNVKDMDQCKETNWVEYQMRWYTTAPKECVEIL